jgi:hypothetical protein
VRDSRRSRLPSAPLVCIYAQLDQVNGNLSKMPIQNAKLLDTCFQDFWQKNKNAKRKCLTVGDARTPFNALISTSIHVYGYEKNN